MTSPIISVRKLRREYQAGDEKLAVLKDVDLDIHRGEMVAIIGQSGSGKSTLMNVLGCLDDGWSGSYSFDGRDVRKLSPDGLAELRREHFGFIFQRYQLMGELDAVENVEVPAIYAGAGRKDRKARARTLLQRLGLGERLSHRPSELSGGQQQRVSVARALMNGGEVILADEPTGALDSRSGTELMQLLQELHGEGHTIIIVTHDREVAAQCQRVVEIRDGIIVSDTKNAERIEKEQSVPEKGGRSAFGGGLDRLREAFAMAVRAMTAHRMRTFLTMLGIIIGIASVVSVVALGQGSQAQVLESISAIGTNTINVIPGTSAADRRSGAIRTLVPSDAVALGELDFVDSVSPLVSTNQPVRYRNVSANGAITGIGSDYFRVNGRVFVAGMSFTAASIESRSQEAILDVTAAETLFGDAASAMGEVIILGNVPVRIIGVVETQTLGMGFGSQQLSIWLPYTTAMARLLNQRHLSAISVRVADGVETATVEAEITALMSQRHSVVDFTLQNTDTIRETIQSTTQTMTLLISMIAIISLVVGGIGVMNIMLVSVSERTKEIGVRMAIGARRSDIMQQFLIEAVLVCLIGGVAGIGLSFAFGQGLTAIMTDARLDYSVPTIIAAFLSSTLIGVVFGFMPARSAARLDPVEALARE